MASLPRLLVVDDEHFNRELLARIFRRHAEVVVAGTWADAAAAAGQPLDVVIVDQRLGQHTGTELARVLRQAWPGLGIVLITGWTDDASVIAARAQGVVDLVVAKPFAPAELRTRVLALARR